MIGLKRETKLYDSVFNHYLDIITERQLLDSELWEKCISVFSSGVDNHDAGWRGEYFGKMMRGACLVYMVRPKEELLDVLTIAVKEKSFCRVCSLTAIRRCVIQNGAGESARLRILR